MAIHKIYKCVVLNKKTEQKEVLFVNAESEEHAINKFNLDRVEVISATQEK